MDLAAEMKDKVPEIILKPKSKSGNRALDSRNKKGRPFNPYTSSPEAEKSKM